MTVVGARPQFIKAAPVSKALRAAGVAEILVHTGQHYDAEMSDVFFRELDIAEPTVNLGIGSGSHGRQTGRMLEALEATLLEQKPDKVLVYGDTNSTLAGVLAAAKLHVPVAHVEAGLRSFNRRMPEEINRIVADTLADILLVPTEAGARNLRAEGIDPAKIHLVGDVMFDAALMFAQRAESTSRVLETHSLRPGSYILATVHRAENTDVPARLGNIVAALAEIARQMPVVWPVHPRTRAAIDRENLLGGAAGVRMISPVGYLDMIRLEKAAALVVTDSGGVQKEAMFYQVPCLTLRDETEWVESVELGWNRLCKPESVAAIVDAARAAIGTRGRQGFPYGQGDAAVRIARCL
jgi:UDP-GlcNAc3NAcA epimerase